MCTMERVHLPRDSRFNDVARGDDAYCGSYLLLSLTLPLFPTPPDLLCHAKRLAVRCECFHVATSRKKRVTNALKRRALPFHIPDLSRNPQSLVVSV